ncbi:MAG: hypothetical protein IT366_24390 [Candidatus Hydrogenedentes bacterium]|nr:hypothetical protein [Candidatus Hydrogenedentota bacterium]
MNRFLTIPFRQWQKLLGRLVVTITLSLTTAIQVFALSFPPPASQLLPNYGLGTDEQSVSTYLTQGIPSNLDAGKYERGLRTDPRTRWQLYGSVVDATVELNYADLAPTVARLLFDQLPLTTDMDLDVCAASRNSNGDSISWEKWDEFRDNQLLAFRTQIARALEVLQNPAALSELARGLDHVSAEYAKKPSSELAQHIVAICRAQARLGEPSGVDRLIQLFPNLSGYDLTLCEAALMHSTGHRFVRSFRNEKRSLNERVSQWSQWWNANKSEFDRSNVYAATLAWSKEPIPKPENLEDYLQCASNDYHPYKNEARAWLDSQGPKLAKKLRAIAVDPNSYARSEASAEYVKFGGQGAKRWLRELALEPSRPGTDAKAMFSPCNPFRLLKEADPGEARDLAKQCIDMRGLRAPLAIQSLERERENAEYLSRVFHSYSDDRGVCLPLIAHLQNLGYEKPDVYETALLQNDCEMAFHAYRAILLFGLETALSNEAKNKLSEWKRDSQFLVATAESLRWNAQTKNLPWKAFADDASRLANADDASSTATHFRIARIYTNAGTQYEKEAETEYAKFIAGVNKYRASRGRALVESAP